MKKRLSALLLMLAILVVPAAATSAYRKQIAIDYGITLNINGQQAVLKDPNGNTVQPFVYNGTTYVPIRAVSENLGATVEYDSSTNTATISAMDESVSQHALKALHYLERASNQVHITVCAYSSSPIASNADYEAAFTDERLTVSPLEKKIDSEYSYVPENSAWIPAINAAIESYRKQADAVIEVANLNPNDKGIVSSVESPLWMNCMDAIDVAVDTVTWE